MNKLVLEIVIFVVVLLIFLTLIFGHVNVSTLKAMVSNWTKISGTKVTP